MVVAVSGWSLPSFFSEMATERRSSVSAPF